MSARTTERAEEAFSEEEEVEEVLREAASSSSTSRRTPAPSRLLIVPKTPEVVDDFLRNFLRRAGLSRTLSSFEAEWYGSAGTRMMMAAAGVPFIPDALTHRQLLHSELETTRRQADRLRQEVLAAGEGLVRVQRERDFHRLRYRRVAEDKNRLIEDLNQLKKHLESYEPTLRQLEDKYQAALRQKMLITLQKDRAQNSTEARPDQEKPHSRKERSDGADKPPPESSGHPQDTEFPVCSHLAQVKLQTWKSPGTFSLSYSIRAHKLPISCIHLHPHKLMLASASEDRRWRLWVLHAGGQKVGELMLTGEGHSDWLSGCSFHPDGTKLATTSGDSTVRLWDLSRGRGVLTLSGHAQPTWGCTFHSCGHFLASCSADRTARIWDLNSQRCRLTLRRHAAAVNSVSFLPCSNLLLTCSADKTLAMWDARLGVCTAAYHGHQHPCNHASFSPAGTAVASCDARGIINLWDARKPALPLATVDAGPLAANQVSFSPSGRRLAVGSDDGLVRLVEVDSCVASSLVGHCDGVQSVTFDHQGETVMSAGSDGMINIWAGNETS